jgi:tryptophan synthase beta chain
MKNGRTAGRFGRFGGCYAPETLIGPLRELAEAHADAKKDPAFRRELARWLRDFVGRPTPLQFAERLTKTLGGADLSQARGPGAYRRA